MNVRVWDNKQCATNYGRLNRKITDTMMCAGERGRDACQVRRICNTLITYPDIYDVLFIQNSVALFISLTAG